MDTIEEKLKRTPQKPGVYLLKDINDKTIYVGKAKLLRNRLRSHFRPGKSEDTKHSFMMAKVRDFEVILTDSEVEALILEANFVKTLCPRYNISLKDDKSYPYIRVTNEQFPRIFVTRKVIRDGSRYFGPYTESGALKQLMQAVRKIFPLRTCTKQITIESGKSARGKVCLNYHIGRCKAPCQALISRDDYLWMVEQVASFIKGKESSLLNDLKAKTEEKARERQFEEAALLRDEIKAVAAFRNRQKVVDKDFKDRDLLTLARKRGEACGMVFNVRDGKIINRRHFFLNIMPDAVDEEVMTSFIEQYYLKADYIAPEIFLENDLPEIRSLESWLSREKGKRVRIVIPKIGDKSRLMKMCAENVNHLLAEYLVQKEIADIKINGPVGSLQHDLGLSSPPLRIEAFDISNIQGQDSVASLVVFENGRPKKSEYRKYKIKTVDGADDCRSIAEVVERRFSRLRDEQKPLPDLIMVDGGKGQLAAALTVLKKLGMGEQPVIGLAKKMEEVFLPGFPEPQNIPKYSAGLHLLQRIRDEAHRFAITFHRQRRKKRIFHSILDDIPGIGEKRRISLLKTFGSLDSIKNASPAELAAAPSMNLKAAHNLHDKLKRI